MGQFAGEFVNPLRIAAALRKTAPIAELDVYHGTPHRFEPTEENPLGEFDASKIGTGEGAQAYGRGIYFAESPDVAKGYRDKLNDPIINRVKADLYEIADAPQWSIKAFDDTGKVIPKVSGYLTPDEIAKHYGDEVAELVLGSKYGGDFKNLAIQEGSLYKADLPDDMIDRMLDYDKPISEQTPSVRDALKKLGIEHGSAQDVVTHLGSKNGQKYLTDVGIPGIRYLDAGSRGKGGTGTRNFVVFPGEEKKVRILERK